MTEFNPSFILFRAWNVSPEADRAWYQARLEKLTYEDRCTASSVAIDSENALRFSFTIEADTEQDAEDIADELTCIVLSLLVPPAVFPLGFADREIPVPAAVLSHRRE